MDRRWDGRRPADEASPAPSSSSVRPGWFSDRVRENRPTLQRGEADPAGRSLPTPPPLPWWDEDSSGACW